MKRKNTTIKSKGATVLLSMAIGVMTCSPVFAASSSSSWKLDMKHRFVQGCDTDSYHTLKKGTAYISGEIKNTKKKNKPSGTDPNSIYVLLLREKFGPDEAVGQAIDLGNKKKISFKNKKLGKTSCNSNKYYLQFYKIYEDDYSAKGSGDVKTE